MFSLRTQQTQRNMPPLPPATMVIDMRGEGEDVISMLEVEIKNLTEEMKQHDIRMWSSLADFIAFKALEPIGDDDITLLTLPDTQEDEQNVAVPQSNGHSTNSKSHMISLTGSADQMDQTSSFPPQYQAANQDQSEKDPDELIPPHPSFAGLPEKIDRLRNLRHNAVSNLGRDGNVGRNVKEPGVRVIFLADAQQSNSLFTTAACAEYLKLYYRKLERNSEHAGQQIPINISVLCMNHLNTGQHTAPRRLIEGLRWRGRWDHLDALILSERYRQDIGRVDPETQNLLAELLLYILLIVSPTLARIRPDAPGAFDNDQDNPDEQKISLPPNTFLVGLSSIENSTRWGYRLLNSGLAEQALQILLDNNPDDELLTVTSAQNWLKEIREQIRVAIPDQLPGTIPAIQGLSTAEKATSPAQGVFSNSQLSLSLGARRVRELEHYLDTTTATYRGGNGATNKSSQQTLATRASTPGSYTLQDAVQCIPQIENALDQRNSNGTETPLVQAQLNAYRVLSHPQHFFQGPQGAIPRAKLQLRELASAISSFQGHRLNNPIDIEAKQKQLRETGQSRIAELNEHIEKWPFFGGFLRLKIPMAWAATIFTCFLCFILVILGFALIDQFFTSVLPTVGTFLSQPLLASVPVFTTLYILLALTFIALIAVSIFVFGRSLLRRPPLSVEIIFIFVLLAIAVLSIVAWWSRGFLTSSVDQELLSLYSPFWRVWVSSIALFIAIVIVIVEVFYYSWWRRELDQECDKIVEAIRTEHQNNIEEVIAYMVDMLALHLFDRAGLSEERTRSSVYFRRVDDLSRLLANTLNYVKEERRLAESRLGSNLDASSLHIREELIDVTALKRGYKRLGAAMMYKRNELKELAEILLRAMGEETPTDIEQQFREKAPVTNRETYYVQILLETLTAIALRFATAIPASDMLTVLERRDTQTISQHSTLQSLIKLLNSKMENSDLDEDASSFGMAGVKDDVPLASRALMTWGQMLWENKDQELDVVLAPGGVIAKLLRSRYNPQTIKETLGIRTSPSGRSLITGQHDELYLFVSPSPESRKFLRDFLPERYVADFPDSERLLLLHIQHYVAKPLVIQIAQGAATPPVIESIPGTAGANGSGGSGQ